MEHELVTVPDAESLAIRAAGFVAGQVRAAIADHGQFSFAVSGGTTPWAMFAELAHHDLPWAAVRIYQVDERVAPDGDPSRNLTHLLHSLGRRPAVVRPMPVTAPDLDSAAAAYASQLPSRFDLVHLGLGPDGHTASLVPDDPVLEVTDRLVAMTRPYQGHRRMTLTYPALARTEELLWLVSGADKHQALTRLLARDPSIPAGRVEARHSTILADTASVHDQTGTSATGTSATGYAP
jgi:6-phosphogluconolactonase